jgi:hypothetical protein
MQRRAARSAGTAAGLHLVGQQDAGLGVAEAEDALTCWRVAGSRPARWWPGCRAPLVAPRRNCHDAPGGVGLGLGASDQRLLLPAGVRSVASGVRRRPAIASGSGFLFAPMPMPRIAPACAFELVDERMFRVW